MVWRFLLGTCNVQFTALKPQPVGALEESNVWIDEAPGVGYSFIRAERGSIKASQQDPLGLKKIAEKPTLVEHRRLFLGQSPDPSHENFSPVWFLLHHHKTTSFADLRKGLSNLQRLIYTFSRKINLVSQILNLAIPKIFPSGQNK